MILNKKIFWISIFLSVVSLIIILVSSFFSGLICNILFNIFISIFSGSIISIATSLITFLNSKRNYCIRYYSLLMNLRNLLLPYINWFAFNYKDVDYENPINEEIEEINNQIVRKFINYYSKIIDFNYDEFFVIFDDYCSLFSFKKENDKIYSLMTSILKSFLDMLKVNDKKVKINLELYYQGTYPEYLIFENVIKKNYKTKELLNIDVKTFDNNINEFLRISKLKKYLYFFYHY